MATKTKQITISDYLIDQLWKRGVQHIFGVPGDYVLRFDKNIEESPIQYINATRENTAGYMADAYGRVRGLGVACITYGVGVNIVNALSQAYVEGSPLVVISGAPGTKELERGIPLHHLLKCSKGFSDTTQLELFKHITLDQAVLNNINTAAADIQRVLDNCIAYQKPVYIELPRDFVEVSIEYLESHQETQLLSDSKALNSVLDQITNLIKQSKRPVIWVGHEIQRYRLAPQLLKFAEQHRIPIVSTLLGKTAVNEHHPLFVGIYQGKVSTEFVRNFVEDSDCFLILGAILNDMDTGLFTAKLDPKNTIELSTQRCLIQGVEYHNIAFPEMIENLSEINLKGIFEPRNQQQTQIHEHAPVDHDITMKELISMMQSKIKPEHYIVSDIGDCLFASSELVLEQDSFLSCAFYSSLGFAVPGSIGVQIADPKRRPICIVGDGAFQMTCMELSTAVRYHLDPIIIVLNNRGYGMERPLLDGKYNDILNWNYAQIPKVLGAGVGVKVHTNQEFQHAFGEALKRRGSYTLIEVEIAQDDYSDAIRRFFSVAKKM